MRRIVAVCAVLALLLLACGGSQLATETTAGPTATTELPSTTSTVPPPTTTTDVPASATTTEPQVATFEVSPETGLVGTVFYASGSGCSGEAYISVFLADVPSGPNDFTIEGHPVPTVGGEWTEELDSAGWPHWVPGSDPPQYEGLGSNPGLYRVSAKCMVGEGFGEVLFDYTDQFFTIEPDGTQPPSKVTTGENIPEALSRDLIPWPEVGPGWYLAMYNADYWDEADWLDGPSILYLVDGEGALYEVDAWDYADLHSVRPDGRLAILSTGEDVLLVETATGEERLIEFDFMDHPPYWLPHIVEFTRPEGIHLLTVSLNTGDAGYLTQELSYSALDGTHLQDLFEQPLDADHPLTPIYRPEGLDVVVSHTQGTSLVSNKGTVIRDLWTPEGRHCKPVRWWEEGQFLATCTKDPDPDIPSHRFHELWVVPTDGTAGRALMPPQEPTSDTDYGYTDAWPTEYGLLVQPSRDLAPAEILLMEADGRLEPLLPDLPGSKHLIDVVGDQVVFRHLPRLLELGLSAYNLETGTLTELIPANPDVQGVMQIPIGLATVYP